MVITPILPYSPLLGMKGWLKMNTNIFNEFRRGLNICLDTNFMKPQSMKQNASKHEAQSNKAIFNIGPNIVP